MQAGIDFEELFGVNAGYVEKVYGEFMAQPDAVSEEWQRFFQSHLPEDRLPQRREPAAPAAGTAVAAEAPQPEAEANEEPIRGVAARIAANMAESLSVPTATSTRVVPVQVLTENRRIVNEFLASEYRGKASFTHFVAWAMVQAAGRVPAMAASYVERDGKAFRRQSQTFNLGMAVDLPGKDGRRSLVVPNIKDCGSMNFATFLAAYGAQIAKARKGKLTPADFADTTASLTNPGTIGTVSSLPRLMPGQSFILATGAIAVPAEFRGAAPETLTELGVSKVMTISSTYDHRVIQGAESGEFLDILFRLLVGEEEFYERIFADLAIPYQPIHQARDQRSALGSPRRESENIERAARVMQYIRSYRVRGYLLANLDPLVYEPKSFPELEMAQYGLTLWDLDREFFSGGVTKDSMASLREIREVLRATYTRRIGVEYMHMVDPVQKEWLRERMEGNRNEEDLPREVMLRVLDRLVEAEAFERFLHTRFVGHKRFSLEGGETLIPVLDALIQRAGEAGVGRAIIGMAHRGRLNVLAHILGKPMDRIFSEFEGQIDPDSTQGSGDVKYHLGASDTFECMNGSRVELELASNPSHLEAVSPVVEGVARARQEHLPADSERVEVLPVLVHGDAAFAGQGVVMETLNMSQLRGYRTGGTVHLIVNNQIGYTTDPTDARSTPFCTDVAKAIQAPIFHVNGDDPLAAVRMVRLALNYRQEFQRDVVLDIVCYRRHGHNEGDEPSFTQPLLYKKIEAHPSVREIYQDYLVRADVLEPHEAEEFTESLHHRLRQILEEVRTRETAEPAQAPGAAPVDEQPAADPDEDVRTAVSTEDLEGWVQKLAEMPDGVETHPKIDSLLERRIGMVAGKQPIDFACAETLAFASLVTAGVPVRLAGQDSGRGTFSQRHSVVVCTRTGDKHIPLNFLADGQARYSVIDSFLSEEAALGFEYGYSVAAPQGLTLWEAQFGDFCNGAQIQIDQFLAAGEAKWRQFSGLTLLLPHGYDGQGPEHSSARLERFLQLVAEDNLRVAYPSTSGQYFHLLRRQALAPTKKPLVVMTPKSMLRQRYAGSSAEELTGGRFGLVLDDPRIEDRGAVRRVVLCSGKIYHDLDQTREKEPAPGVALLRVEQLAPWPVEAVAEALSRYPGAEELVWCQEEPANMGAWTWVQQQRDDLRYVGRPAAASPATGMLARHKREQAALVAAALGR